MNQSIRRLAVDCLSGSLSGAIASLPMAIAMELQKKYMPVYARQSLPPEKITRRITQRLGMIKPTFQPKKKELLTALSHFGYGAVAGMAYPALERRIKLPGALKGGLYGLFVWAISYRGWLPIAGIWRPKAELNPRKRMMITSHIVWGACLGALNGPIEKRILLRQSERIFK